MFKNIAKPVEMRQQPLSPLYDLVVNTYATPYQMYCILTQIYICLVQNNPLPNDKMLVSKIYVEYVIIK